MARRIFDDGWPVARAAEYFNVSSPTAKRWGTLCVEVGPDGMYDRSSRPHRSPNRTAEPIKRKIVALRWRQHLSPQASGSRLNMPAATVHAVLVRCRVNRFSHVDIRAGE